MLSDFVNTARGGSSIGGGTADGVDAIILGKLSSGTADGVDAIRLGKLSTRSLLQ